MAPRLNQRKEAKLSSTSSFEPPAADGGDDLEPIIGGIDSVYSGRGVETEADAATLGKIGGAASWKDRKCWLGSEEKKRLKLNSLCSDPIWQIEIEKPKRR